VREAVAEAPQAERRILARSGSDPLLAAEVVRPDDDRVRRGRGEQALVDGPLLFDAR